MEYGTTFDNQQVIIQNLYAEIKLLPIASFASCEPPTMTKSSIGGHARMYIAV